MFVNAIRAEIDRSAQFRALAPDSLTLFQPLPPRVESPLLGAALAEMETHGRAEAGVRRSKTDRAVAKRKRFGLA